MKLLFCPECDDIIKLTRSETRSCKCGQCVGKYVDNLYAVTNGNGICLAISNPDLLGLIIDGVFGKTPVTCWARPHEGKHNPHTIVDPDLKKEV